jgi:hypothetical protein
VTYQLIFVLYNVIAELEKAAYANAAKNDQTAVALLKEEEETARRRRLDTVKIGIDLSPLLEPGAAKSAAAAALKGNADGDIEGDAKHRVGKVCKEEGVVKDVSKLFTDATEEQASHTMTAFGELFELLLTKYHDGAIATQRDSPNLVMVKMFYPQFWLNATGYFENKPNFGPGVLMFDNAPGYSAGGMSISALFVWTLTTLAVGMYVGRKYFGSAPTNRDYVQIGTGIEML